MDRWGRVLSAAWVPVLSGCMMMGGMSHMGGSTPSTPGDPGGVDPSIRLRRAEASTGDLTIVLSLASPVASSEPVPIEARLSGRDVRGDSNDDVVWLLIEMPNGAVDQVPMERTEAGTYRAWYHFSEGGGPYLLTAEARSGLGGDTRTVSVTMETEVEVPRSGRHGWTMPMAIVGGLVMAAWMAVMMAS